MSDWISVNDKLPAVGEKCLYHAPVFEQNHSHSNVWFGQHDGDGNFSSRYGFFGGQEVTHWMPVKAPPTKEAK
jgi:hypothetical protein